MKSNCIICGCVVELPFNTQIPVCEGEHCVRIVEDNIGLHYTQPKLLIGCDTAKPDGDISAQVVYQGGEVVKVSYNA